MSNVTTEFKSIPKEFLSCVLDTMKELKRTCDDIAIEVEDKYFEDKIVSTINQWVYSLKSTLYSNLKTLDSYSYPDRLDVCPIHLLEKTLKEVEDILYNKISQLLETHKIKSGDKCMRVYFATMMELYKMTLKAKLNNLSITGESW